MPEIQYKFKSSLSFEIIRFSESCITVGTLKDLINQKQSIKTSGFDLKLKDSHGKVYTDDEDLIDINSKIIVSRVPKVCKTPSTTKAKEIVVSKDVNETVNETTNANLNIPVTDINISHNDSESQSANMEFAPSRQESEVPPVLTCCLCNNLMKNAMQIKCCKTNYCHECITGYLFDPDISGSMECPNCKCSTSGKDVNLIDNMKIRALVYNFQQGKLDNDSLTELGEDVRLEDELNFQLDNLNEVEIALPVSNESSEADQAISQSCDTTDALSQDNDRVDESNDFDSHNEVSQIESITNNTLSLNEFQAVTQPLIERNQNICLNDINPIEQHYQGHSYPNIVSIDQEKFTNRVEIPVISASSHVPEMKIEMKTNTFGKDSFNVSIQDLDFDPVLYMKFLKIVGESWPEELSKILSNNNDHVSSVIHHMSQDNRKSTNSSRRAKDGDYHDKYGSSKKARYELNIDESKYKKSYNGADKPHPDINHRYYDNGTDKRSNRVRSRSKEHSQKKPTEIGSYPNQRRSRDYEARDREYYGAIGGSSSSGTRYRGSDNGSGQNNYHQDERNKYRSAAHYNSSTASGARIKSSTSKYKRPMDR